METELFASVEAGDFDKFKELIKKETKETIDQVDFYGYTALHAAGEKGRTEMIPLLLGKNKIGDSHKIVDMYDMYTKYCSVVSHTVKGKHLFWLSLFNYFVHSHSRNT